AKAAKNAKKSYFQSGLQQRSDPEIIHILNFVRAGAAGTAFLTRSQYHKKNSWRRSSPNPQFEQALNWRVNQATFPRVGGGNRLFKLRPCWWVFNPPPAPP